MGFCDAVSTCFSKYVDFSGRAPRSEYWWWVLFVIIARVVLGLVDAVVFGFDTENIEVFGPIFQLATVLPYLAVTARRLHDVERSGWWQAAPYGTAIVAVVLALPPFIFSVAIAGAVMMGIILLVWLIEEGTVGPNRFGPAPLGAGALSNT